MRPGPRVPAGSLRDFYRTVFLALRASPAAANAAAEGLLYADLHGIDSHGAANLVPIYVNGIRSGEIDPRAEPSFIIEGGATATLDARRALGFYTASLALDRALSAAWKHGMGAVAVRNSTHCGSCGFYVKRALDAGAIALALTNLGNQAILRPPGGNARMIGTNVIAAGAPAGSQAPFLLDMSTSVAATGRIRLALDSGRDLPGGWLVDAEGNDLIDPSAYFEGNGFLQFLGGSPETGGFKGYGLALLVEILAGILPGAAVGPTRDNAEGRVPPSQGGIGHFVLVIAPSAFGEADRFAGKADEMLAALQVCPPSGKEPVQYPGLPEVNEARRRRRDGVPISPVVYEQLTTLAAELGTAIRI